MEFYAGGTLGDQVRDQGPLSLADLLVIGVQIAGALETAHQRGVIHRDIKPQNLFVSDFGQAALGDFGISSFDDDRTITGGAGGLTVHYAPPELLEGESATAQSDVYSLAATLYSLATGSRPFPRGDGQTIGELARRILIEPAPRLANHFGSAELSDLLVRSMSKRPDDRPPTAEQFGRELQSIQAGLGLVETAMPMASTDQPVEKRADLSSVGGNETVATFARPRVSGHEPSTTGESLPGNGGSAKRLFRDRDARSWLVVAVVGLAFVAALALGAQRGEETDASGSTSSADLSTTSDPFFSAPAIPRSVSVTPSSEGVSALVTWDAVDGAEGYQVEIVGTAEVVEVAEPVAMLPDSDDVVCVAVRSIGPVGKLSPASDTVCAQP